MQLNKHTILTKDTTVRINEVRHDMGFECSLLSLFIKMLLKKYTEGLKLKNKNLNVNKIKHFNKTFINADQNCKR